MLRGGEMLLVQLKIRLFEQRISQNSLARATGISRIRLSRLMQGHTKPRARERRLIADALGVREDEIFPNRRNRKRDAHFSSQAPCDGEPRRSERPASSQVQGKAPLGARSKAKKGI